MITNEYEKKKLLTEKEYNDKIAELSRFAPATNIIQINYYCDTAEFDFYKRNETVRVRQKDNKLTLEYKSSKQTVNNTKISKEIARPMEVLPKRILVDNFELSLVGSLTTYRINFQIDNFIVSFDKNFYLGIVDFEIEIEVNNLDDTLPLILDIFDEVTSLGKYTRFVTALKNMDEQVCLNLM